MYRLATQGWEKRYDEIVEIDRLRPHVEGPTTAMTIERHTLDVPPELNVWVHDVANLRDQIKDKCGALGLTLFDPAGGAKNAKNKKGAKGKAGGACQLVVLGDKSAASKAAMLLKLHAKHQVGLKGLKEKAAGLEEATDGEQRKEALATAKSRGKKSSPGRSSRASCSRGSAGGKAQRRGTAAPSEYGGARRIGVLNRVL